MCGIVGYTGKKQAAPILLDGLLKLEYRGYDSAGIAVRQQDNEAEVIKAKGRLKILLEKTNDGSAVKGETGIGHTRWATHGEPSERNAHPIATDDKNVIAVHNGIIDNYQEIREKLTRHDYLFHTETDTEAVVKLIDYYYKKYKVGPIDALAKTMVRVRGSYALVVMFSDYPGEIYVARKDSPLIVGQGDGETFVASDVPAILKYTREVYYLDNLEMARLNEGEEPLFYNLDGDTVKKEKKTVEWDVSSAEKGGYEHFMIKEINEQPKAVEDTVRSYVKRDSERKDPYIDLSETGLTDEILKSIKNIEIVACGSAAHAGYVLENVIERLVGIPVRSTLASEFRYKDPLISEDTLAIFISQSGETADTLKALELAKKKGAKTLGIVNVLGSSISREAEFVMYTMAGPEISVATTKAYSAQLVAGYILATALSYAKGKIDDNRKNELLTELFKIPEKIERILSEKERLQWFSSKFSSARDVFYIGRGLDYSVCMEGSLKLKEVSYIHSEAYAAGELKHGTISLIEDGILVIGVLTQENIYEKTISNMKEVKARGAYLLGITTYGNYDIEDTADFSVFIPKTEELFTPSLSVIPLQLIGYYISVSRGVDVDKPRNLAKSVTVE